jgi:hypothetical protein
MKKLFSISENIANCCPYVKVANGIATLLLFLLISGNSIAQQTAEMKDVQVWAVPGEQKVRPNDRVETNNLVWSGEKKQIKVAGAGNEHVPFQVVITTPVPPGWRPEAPDGFFVIASDLKSAEGKIIPQKQVNLFLVHYIQIYAISSPVGATGLWPDALAPLKEPFSMQAQYAVVGNRPVWVDVYIPAGTPKGTYSGSVTVTRFGKVIETLVLKLRYMGSPSLRKHILSLM